MTMIERVARALTGHIGATCCHKTGGVNADPRCECRALARAAIEELRVPTTEMVSAFDNMEAWDDDGRMPTAFEAMEAMITAALTEKGEVE